MAGGERAWSASLRSQFLQRDTMHKRGLCRHAVSVCLSVCVSVTFVSCVETSNRIVRLFSPSGSPTILVHQTGWQYSDGNPLTAHGGVECQGV